MNRKIFFTIVAALCILNSCGNKKTDTTSEEQEAVEQAVKNEPKREKAQEIISDKVHLLSTQDFIDLVTEINNPKGFQYKGSIPCIVEFFAGWCAPCHALAPVLEELASEYQGKIIIYKVDVDRANELNAAMGVSNVPTIFFFKKDSAPTSIVGAPSKADLKKAIEDVLIKKTN